MKSRHVLFLLFVALVLVLFAQPQGAPAPDQPPGFIARSTKVVDRAFKALAIWWLLRDAPAPPEMRSDADAMPELANHPPQRALGPDGVPVIDHSDGW